MLVTDAVTSSPDIIDLMTDRMTSPDMMTDMLSNVTAPEAKRQERSGVGGTWVKCGGERGRGRGGGKEGDGDGERQREGERGREDREGMLMFGHPARGGRTSFVSSHSLPFPASTLHDQSAPPPPRRDRVVGGAGGVGVGVGDGESDGAGAGEGVGVGGVGVARRRVGLGLDEAALLLGLFHSEFKISREVVSTAAQVCASLRLLRSVQD
jgi:hypothetical protein